MSVTEKICTYARAQARFILARSPPTSLLLPPSLYLSRVGRLARPGGTMPHSASTKAARVSRNSACHAKAHRVDRCCALSTNGEDGAASTSAEVASRVAHCRRRRQAASGSKRSKGREKQHLHFILSESVPGSSSHQRTGSTRCAGITGGPALPVHKSEMDALGAICPCSGTRRRTKCHKIGGSGEPSRCRGGRWRWAMGTGWWALASMVGGGEPILVKMCKR